MDNPPWFIRPRRDVVCRRPDTAWDSSLNLTFRSRPRHPMGRPCATCVPPDGVGRPMRDGANPRHRNARISQRRSARCRHFPRRRPACYCLSPGISEIITTNQTAESIYPTGSTASRPMPNRRVLCAGFQPKGGRKSVSPRCRFALRIVQPAKSTPDPFRDGHPRTAAGSRTGSFVAVASSRRDYSLSSSASADSLASASG